MAGKGNPIFGEISAGDVELLEEIVGQATPPVSGAVIHAHQIEKLKSLISKLKPAAIPAQLAQDDAPIQATVEDTIVETQKDLTVLTAEEFATSYLVHEAHTKFVKLDLKANDKWVYQGLGPIRILTNKETAKPRILVRADLIGKVVLDFNVMLNKNLYTVRNNKMVRLSVPAEDKRLETFMCTFRDEGAAKGFLDRLHEAIAEARLHQEVEES